MLNEIFSDCFAHKDNFLTRIDARIKMFFVFAAIITLLFSSVPVLSIIVAFIVLIFLISVGTPLKIILFRLLAPLTLVTVIVVMEACFYGPTPLFGFTVFGFHLTVYKEGLFLGLSIAGRVVGTMSLVIFLSMTTPLNAIFRAASWFRVSQTWTEIALIAYRYVFVLIEDAVTIRDAQVARLGYSNLSRGLRSLAELAGSVFIRAYDQSVSTYEAMQLRGYSGAGRVLPENRFQLKDALHLVIFSVILFLLIGLNLHYNY